MDQDQTEQKNVNARRRNFLAVAASVPALAVAALIARKPEIEVAAPAAPAAPPEGTGYHETEHIRKYYYTAAYF